MPDLPFPIHTAFVVLYLLVLVGLGLWKSGKITNQEEFSLAGRNLGVVVLVGTLLATWIGTGSIFGNAEQTYKIGLGAFVIPLGGVLGILVLSTLAGRIRRIEGVSIQDILDARFGRAARFLASVTLILAYVIIVSYQYRAGASVLERLVPQLDPAVATCIVAGFVIAYTALAGMVSVAYTDLANGILITVGIFVALPLLFFEAGGSSGIRETLAKPEMRDIATFGSALTPFNVINWCLPAFLLILGDANMYQRFFSARSPSVAKRSAVLMIVGIAILEVAIVAVAFLGRVLVEQGVLQAPSKQSDIIVSLAFDVLPPVLGAVLMGTIIAVVVSTADSFLLAPATAIVRDLTRRESAREQRDHGRREVLLSRAIVVVFGLVALVLAFQSKSFFKVALFAYTVYGASVTPVLIATFFWKRATTQGAVASMLAGSGVALWWQWMQLEKNFTSPALADIDAVLPALLAACVALVVVSLLTQKTNATQRG
ncbi:MAG: sodium:solute symporter family protein [Planctomycetes bacterium]|nr:sodium:solute symporter family protein [Planctomycetota bacterium]